MSVTYTPAAHRVLRQVRAGRWHLGMQDAMLVAASILSIAAIALACAGRLSALDASERAAGRAAVVNLNTVADSETLEPALSLVFTDPPARRSAARALFRFLLEHRESGRQVPNVGALAGARAETGTAAPAAGLLLTSSQLAVLKPSFTVRTREAFRTNVLLFGLLYVLGFHIVSLVWRLRSARSDALILVTAHLLTAIGFAAILARPDPLRDTFLTGRYVEGILLGLALMTAVSLVNFRTIAFLELSYVPLLAALSLSVILLLVGSGPAGSSAKVNLGPVQPIEGIRLLLALFLAGYFGRRWELLRIREGAIRHRRLPDWINLPRSEYVMPVAAGVGMALFFFFLQKDLGPALFTCCVFLAIYAVARGRTGMAVAGLAVLLLAFYVGHVLHVSQTLTDRVGMWQSPWNNAVAGGDQIAHALWAMSTGGISGTGLGLGDTRYLPAGHTDLILAAIGEELGALGLLLVTVLYGMLAWRGFRIGRLAHNDYGFFLATTMTLFLIVPVFIMASGVVGVSPLTGVVTPFLSYGGSAMIINFIALGVLASIHADRRPPIDFTPFRAPMRWLGTVLGAAALVLLAVVVNVQVVHGDDYLVRPHLGVQADGGLRFAYNPRVLDVVRAIPRGTIYDRLGLPLATDDMDAIAKARDAYRKLDVSLADVCAGAGERCYPLGGRAFHLLGDARTRINWSAPNTSYVERDGESTLRGFDDHASTVATDTGTNQPGIALKRDYRAVVPLLRHRHDPDDEAVVAFRDRPRDVQLTIDAGFQLRTASIVAKYAQRSGGKAAAVVLDPDTGELLASASYPWPDRPGTDTEALLDRARYGLYPPGSTFKLVTASAALRERDELVTTPFICSRLPDGRVGARIPGWGRPIRDDVLESHPHGSINLHDGLVRSCNAYFAQLAVKLGPEALLAAAAELGIPLTQARDVRARVDATLPQIGYGQGDVVATPLRMARVAAAVASEGVLRDVRWQKSRPAAEKGRLDLGPKKTPTFSEAGIGASARPLHA